MKAEKFLKLYAENETEIKSTYYLYMAMRKMKEECEQEVRDNANKKAGHGKIENYAKKITKANPAGMPALHYAKTIDGRQYFCDGHRLLILDNPIAFEECPHDMRFPDYEKNYDQIAIRVPKGKREAYKKKAESKGKSLAQYIVDLIENDK